MEPLTQIVQAAEEAANTAKRVSLNLPPHNTLLRTLYIARSLRDQAEDLALLIQIAIENSGEGATIPPDR